MCASNNVFVDRLTLLSGPGREREREREREHDSMQEVCWGLKEEGVLNLYCLTSVQSRAAP